MWLKVAEKEKKSQTKIETSRVLITIKKPKVIDQRY